MGKSATLRQWASLFEVINSLKEIQPWLYVCSDDLICIRPEKKETLLFCSVMGYAGDCYGVSIFEGDAGLQDFCRIRDIDQDLQSPMYVMRDQTCLTIYWGDRDEVPPDQKAVMKDLGLRFRGSGNWPYAVSFERRYASNTPDANGVVLLTETLGHLYMVARAFAEGRIEPKWDRHTMLVRTYGQNDQLWHMGWMEVPEYSQEYPRADLEDELLKARLKKAPQAQTEILMDLIYLDGVISGGHHDRDYWPLCLVVADTTAKMIISCNLLKPTESELEAAISAFVECVLDQGKMKRIRARNPRILAALKDICACCGISLVRSALPEMDEIEEELSQHFQ